MPSLRTRTAIVLTAGVAAAAALPAGVAAAAGPLPASALPEALPVSTVTSVLPTQALPTRYVTGALGYSVAAARDLRLDPLANTGVDPLTNGIGSKIADFRPVSTTSATAPITNGGSLGTLPLVGPLTGLLPH